MITRHTINGFAWIDLNSPTEEEIKSVAEEYNIEHSITRDLSSPTPKPRVFESGKYLYTIFHIPAFKNGKNEETEEIDFIIGRGVLITTRYGHMDAMHKFEKETEVEEILDKNDLKSEHLFFRIMHSVQENMFNELLFVEDWISSMEKKIFSGKEKEEKEMVIIISEASRKLLNFRKTIEPHKDIFQFLKEKGEDRFGKAFSQNTERLFQNWQRLDEISRNHSAMLSELRETNNSLLNTQQNEIMKMLTIFTFIFLPASVIASLFGVSAKLPIEEGPNAFYIILCIIVAASAALFLFLKAKKWI